MNNEIKEILDFKENADYKKLSCDEIVILRDYITNLEERIEQALEYIKENKDVDLYDDVGSAFMRNLLSILEVKEGDQNGL